MQKKRDELVTAIALVADMIFASRIRGAAEIVGKKVRTVGTPEALLERAREEKPGLIFIDLDSRVGDSAALIRELKADPELAEIPLIAFGAHIETEALRAAHEGGADRVLARSALVKILPSLLEGTESDDPTPS